jgi:hypothetical protein
MLSLFTIFSLSFSLTQSYAFSFYGHFSPYDPIHSHDYKWKKTIVHTSCPNNHEHSASLLENVAGTREYSLENVVSLKDAREGIILIILILVLD